MFLLSVFSFPTGPTLKLILYTVLKEKELFFWKQKNYFKNPIQMSKISRWFHLLIISSTLFCFT